MVITWNTSQVRYSGLNSGLDENYSIESRFDQVYRSVCEFLAGSWIILSVYKCCVHALNTSIATSNCPTLQTVSLSKDRRF